MTGSPVTPHLELRTDDGRAVEKIFYPERVTVHADGLASGERVTLRAVSGSFASSASFVIGPDGTLDLARDVPASGDWQTADPDGPFWSMRSPNAGDRTALPVQLTIERPSASSLSTTLSRTAQADDAVIVRLHEQGLVGVFVAPPGPGPFPALLVFGGSEGGLTTGEFEARFWSGLGYACLGVAYFDAPGLPAELSEIPLEYFGQALSWLAARPEVDAARLGVAGGSRGGEAALLIGAHFPQVRAVVADVPSGVSWGAPQLQGPERPAWTFAGVAVPFMPDVLTAPTIATAADGVQLVDYTPSFQASLASASAAELEAASIRVENTQGAVLLIAGQDDHIWPSCELAQIAKTRLDQRGHTAAHGDEYRCYADAGHWIAAPGTPTTTSDRAYFPATGEWLAIGGTPAGSAAAGRAAFELRRSFLATHLAP